MMATVTDNDPARGSTVPLPSIPFPLADKEKGGMPMVVTIVGAVAVQAYAKTSPDPVIRDRESGSVELDQHR